LEAFEVRPTVGVHEEAPFEGLEPDLVERLCGHRERFPVGGIADVRVDRRADDCESL
jgi:hypothetical protein